MPSFRHAPDLEVAEWLNRPEPIRLADLRGKVVVMEAFQMLCPGACRPGDLLPTPDANQLRGRRPAMDLHLNGRRALVTGSSSGISEAIVKAITAEGTAVLVHGRSAPRAEAVAAAIH